MFGRIILASLLIQGCLLETRNERPGFCEGGDHAFTRLYHFDAKDSLSAVVDLDAVGDTTSLVLFEYDSAGRLIKSLFILKAESSAPDTTCFSSTRSEDGRTIRGAYCDNPERMTSLSTLDENGRITGTAFYNDSTFYTESFFAYDAQGRLVQVETISAGEKYVSATYQYDESGKWIGSREFDRNGKLTATATGSSEARDRTRTRRFDGLGKVTVWEINFLNSRMKILETIGCKPKAGS